MTTHTCGDNVGPCAACGDIPLRDYESVTEMERDRRRQRAALIQSLRADLATPVDTDDLIALLRVTSDRLHLAADRYQDMGAHCETDRLAARRCTAYADQLAEATIVLRAPQAPARGIDALIDGLALIDTGTRPDPYEARAREDDAYDAHLGGRS